MSTKGDNFGKLCGSLLEFSHNFMYDYAVTFKSVVARAAEAEAADAEAMVSKYENALANSRHATLVKIRKAYGFKFNMKSIRATISAMSVYVEFYWQLRSFKRQLEEKPAQIPKSFIFELFLPHEKLEIVDNLEYLFEKRWLPKFGKRKAKILFYKEAYLTIFHIYTVKISKIFGILKALELLSKFITGK